jgi:thioredoxin-related protein
MKKGIVSLLFVFIFCSAMAQSSTEPPYKQFPTVPPMQLLLADSSSRFTKNDLPKKKPVFIMLFSPDCGHCQHTAEELVKYKDDFKDIQVVMATLSPLWQMNEFTVKYKLKELPNIVLGKDVSYILPAFYNIKNLPFMAFYNKKGDLISIYEGSLDISRVVTIFNENK